MKFPRLLSLGFASALFVAVGAPTLFGQLRWSAYNPSTGALLAGANFEQAATFDPATNSYTFTIPAGTAVTLVTTSLLPVDLPKPASGSVVQTITFEMQTSAGGFSALNRFANFGLFSFPADAAPTALSNNATGHSGLWMTAYSNGSTTYQSKPCGSPNSAGLTFANPPDFRLASTNIQQTTTGFGLGTSRLNPGTGVMADNTVYKVTFRARGNSAGTTQLGTGTDPATAGTVWADAETNGANFLQTASSSATNNGFTCPASFNEFAFYFDNGSANPVTLTLANLKAHTSSGTPFNLGPAYFTTQPPPAITATLGGVLAIPAAAVAVNVTGGPSTSYQWQVSTDGGNSYADIDVGTHASAATTSLWISEVQPTHAGLYRLKATTSFTGAVSGAASVVSYSEPSLVDVSSDVQAPFVISPPASASILVGESNTFSVVSGGSTPLTFQWSRSLDGGANYTPISGATAAQYTLALAQLADTGLYRVTISNAEGSVTSEPATLTVNAVPTITNQPTGGTVNPGGSLTLSVTATGVPAPTYQWRKNGVAIPGATSPNYTISNATGASTGSYTVVVTNSVGSVTSTAAAVGVLSATFAPSAFGPASSGRNPDTRLTLTFNEAPTVGVSGLIRIHDAANDAVVDTIDLVAATSLRDTLRLGGSLSTQMLPVQKKPIGSIAVDFNYYPITVAGNTATIHPRNNVLAYGKTYYVTVEPGAFVNSLGETFAGISDPNTWRFSTKGSGPAAGATTLVVAADGSGDFDTVQGALDFVPAANTTPRLIRIRKGTYFEIVAFTAKHNLTLLGESADETAIVYPNNNNFNNVSGGVYHRATFIAHNVSGFTFANLTVNNPTPQGGSQAEALIISGTSASAARNLVTNGRFYSYQDTVQFNKQTYVSDSVIHGDVDFLWGDGPTFLENCDIRFLRTGGYLTQIRNGSGNHGYVFVNCRFTAPAGLTGNFLSRIAPVDFPNSEVVILDSRFGDATNNSFLATATGSTGSAYNAGWWRLDGVTNTTSATNVRFWTNNLRDANDAPLNNPNADAFTQMPPDATTQANYRNATWVLNTTMAGTMTGSWTPALAPLIGGVEATQAVAAGAPITLRVSAVGVPGVSYQWRKDGADIPGATSATFQIASATAQDSANYSVLVTNSAGETTSELIAVSVQGTVVPPAIDTAPQSQAITEGDPLVLSVTASGTAPFTYQWKKDGADLPGATSSTFAIAFTVLADAGNYTVVVGNSAGSVTSDAAVITVKGIASIRTGGYAGAVTGGAAGATVVVTTAAQLKSFAESTTPYTIIVSGTIDLGANQRIKPRSNRTIRGATVNSTILGTLEISNANNVIISNLNISADTGGPGANDGITIGNSTNVLVTKCTIYNCTDGNLDIVEGSDLVTISWCKFHYTRDNGHNFSNLVGSSDSDTGTGDGRTNYRVTWHHNWWTGLAKQRMIACRFGRSHMYNNLWDCSGNDYATETRNIAAIFSEFNYYQGVKDPLAKRTSLPTDVGLLMTIGNLFVSCTGKQQTGSDVVFTPPYSYHLHAALDVPAIVRAGAGNVTTDTPSEFAAAINGPAGAVAAGQGATLTAAFNGFTAAGYQWRFRNAAINDATAPTLQLANVQEANAGDYSVAITLGDGSVVVSTPYALTVGPALTGAELWRQQYFGQTANSGDAADLADPDADGLTNLVEYALGLDPTVVSNANLPGVAAGASEWTFTYTRPADRTDVNYAVEVSTTLTAWTTNGVTHERTATGTVETWEARVPLATGANVFFRLRVERP